MRAAYVTAPGPAETLIFGDLPTPQPTGAQVLVKVAAVSVNPVDTYVRGGIVNMNVPLPYIPGADLAGTVEAVGPDVRWFKPGDRVWGSNQGLLGRQGTFAEYACVDEAYLYPSPTGVSDEHLAAVALVAITAHLGLFRDAKIQPGETLYVPGGLGGVGSMVVQMAKAAEARVITSCGTHEKCARAIHLGASAAFNYKQVDAAEELKRIAPGGVNLWWETQRDPNFDIIVEHLAPRGRIVLMAGREARPTFPVGPFYVKGCSMHGFVMFNAPPDEQRRASEDINAWLAEGKLTAVIDRVLPLSEAAQAHRLQEDATLHKTASLNGKLVLVV